MKHIYAVETEKELIEYLKYVKSIEPKLNGYIDFLKREYEVVDLPKTIVWTSGEIATNYISNIPIPAYTNEHRVVMTPVLETWREIYLKQLDKLGDSQKIGNDVNAICDYYRDALSENHMLQILGHELAHHSELFLEDFNSDYSDGIWFEEGMVEYISRQYFLTEEEFEAEVRVNRRLVDLLKERYGNHSLEQFGKSTYEGDYASIFFEYWRSFLAVKQIVEDYKGDIKAVFTSYHRWNEECNGQTLLEWFDIE
ncbi:MAG: hypothetical protein IKW08_02245 [Roseburia sp.]|nr:hypothetical protein [Roseburia sp.]